MSVITDVPWSEYCDIPRMNPSTLVYGCKSMLSLKRKLDAKVVDGSDKKRFGSGYHALLLEPDKFEARHVVMPDFELEPANKTKTGEYSQSKSTSFYKESVRQFMAENEGREVLTRKEYDRALYMIEAMRSKPVMADILDRCTKEVTLLGEIEGVEFKGRVDLLGDVLADAKSTGSVEPGAFGRIVANLRYPFKMAIYRELARQNGRVIEDVVILAQEDNGDFDNVVYPLREVVLDNAFKDVIAVVKDYKRAMRTGLWHGVDKGQPFVELPIPNWSMPEEVQLEWEDAA